MIKARMKGVSGLRTLGIISLFASAISASADEPLFVDLHQAKTGLALEAHALDKAGKGFHEDHALRTFTDYFRLDEFDQRAHREEYIGDIREGFEEAATSIDSVDYFIIDGAVNLGDFDFQTKSFPMLNFYKSASGSSYYIDLERKRGMDPEWYYDSGPFGANTISNYWPRVETPGRGLMHRWQKGQFQFDWAPVIAKSRVRSCFLHSESRVRSCFLHLLSASQRNLGSGLVSCICFPPRNAAGRG